MRWLVLLLAAEVLTLGGRVVPNKVAVADHFVAFGGGPLCAVLDRPKTVALKWAKNGEVADWNPILAYTALELGFTDDVRSSSSAGFHDREHLQTQLCHSGGPGAPPAAGVVAPATAAGQSRTAGVAHRQVQDIRTIPVKIERIVRRR